MLLLCDKSCLTFESGALAGEFHILCFWDLLKGEYGARIADWTVYRYILLGNLANSIFFSKAAIVKC